MFGRVGVGFGKFSFLKVGHAIPHLQLLCHKRVFVYDKLVAAGGSVSLWNSIFQESFEVSYKLEGC